MLCLQSGQSYVNKCIPLVRLLAYSVGTKSVQQITLCPNDDGSGILRAFEELFDAEMIKVENSRQLRIVCPKYMHPIIKKKLPSITVTANRAPNPFLSSADREFMAWASTKTWNETHFAHYLFEI